MLHKLPKRTPPLSVMLSDLGNPRAEAVAKALGVSTRTVYGWIRQDDAPRPALIALFWLTSWGMQWLDADLFNGMRAHKALADSLRRQIESGDTHVPTNAKGALRRPLLYVVK